MKSAKVGSHISCSMRYTGEMEKLRRITLVQLYWPIFGTEIVQVGSHVNTIVVLHKHPYTIEYGGLFLVIADRIVALKRHVSFNVD